jgi:hypothetical protein
LPLFSYGGGGGGSSSTSNDSIADVSDDFSDGATEKATDELFSGDNDDDDEEDEELSRRSRGKGKAKETRNKRAASKSPGRGQSKAKKEGSFEKEEDTGSKGAQSSNFGNRTHAGQRRGGTDMQPRKGTTEADRKTVFLPRLLLRSLFSLSFCLFVVFGLCGGGGRRGARFRLARAGVGAPAGGVGSVPAPPLLMHTHQHRPPGIKKRQSG